MKVIDTLAVTAAMLISSNVEENDHPGWSAAITYAAGARVMLAHHSYESIADGNIGHSPDTSPTAWLDLGSTNRWAMFDQAGGSVTAKDGPIIVEIAPSTPVDAVAMVDVLATSVRVQISVGGVGVYDRTIAVENDGIAPSTVNFLDVPPRAGARIIITIASQGGGPIESRFFGAASKTFGDPARVFGQQGSTAVSIGTLIVGNQIDLGATEQGPTVGINDFSRRQTDDFGVTTIVERAWAKRMSVRSLIPTADVDETQRRLAGLRAKPSLWIGEDGFDSLVIYGFFKDFSIDLALETISYCTLTIEGLTTAPGIDNSLASLVAAISDGSGKLIRSQTLQESVSETATAVTAARDAVAAARTQIDQTRIDLAAEVVRAQQDTASIRVVAVQQQTDIGGNTSRITTEALTRASADSALSYRTSQLEAASGGGGGPGDPTLTARIANEETVRANADSALANRATTVESQLAGNSGSAVLSRIATEETTRASADDALAGRSTTIEAKLDGTTGSPILSRIATEEITRSNADGALSSRMDTIVASANGYNDTELRGLISTESTTRANADGALANRSTTLEAQVAGNQGSNLLSRITDEATVRSTNDTSLAQRIDSISANGGYNDTVVRGLISNEATVRATADSALATRVDSVTSSFNSAGVSAAGKLGMTSNADFQNGDAGWNTAMAFPRQGLKLVPTSAVGASAGIGELRLNRVDTSRAYRIHASFRSLGTQQCLSYVGVSCFDAYGSYLGNIYSLAATPSTTRGQVVVDTPITGTYPYAGSPVFSGGSAFIPGTAFVQLLFLGNYDSQPGAYVEVDYLWLEDATAAAKVDARVGIEESTRATADGALSSRVATVEASYITGGTAAAIADARVASEATARANADGALGTRVDTVAATANGAAATAGSQASAVADLRGRTAAYVKTTAVAGNNRAQVTIFADANAGAGVDIVGDVKIKGDLFVDGSIIWRNMDLSQFAKRGSASWSGYVQPTNGQTLLIPVSVNLGTIKPSGYFTVYFTANVTSDVGSSYSTYNGRPITTTAVDDGGITAGFRDAQGNFYGTTQTQDVLATTEFLANFLVSVTKGTLDTGIVNEGDYYTRRYSATYQVSYVSIQLRWTAF